MSAVVIGIGDGRVSNDPEAVLVTYALGSCIGVMIHDRKAGVGGLLHFMLPESGMDKVKAEKNPFLFGDTGIPLLFQKAYGLGADKRRMVVTVVGGAQLLDPHGTFNIGKRNYLTMRKVLWKAGLLVHAEDVGGNSSRTVRLEVGSGKVWLRKAGEVEQDLQPSAIPQKGVPQWHTTS